MIRGSIGVIPLPLAASAGSAFAQSHAGHGAAQAAAQGSAILPAGCVRRGSPTADAARTGTPGAPVCPAGAVPERSAPVVADPHAGHDMSTMGRAQPAPAMPAGHDMPAGRDMSGMAMPPDVPTQGELTARVEVEYDQRITQKWIVQPRAEVVVSAGDIPELSIGSGLSSLQLGVRVRYEIRKEFAPYVGVEWTRRFGDTRDFLEADGRSVEDTRLVVGIRTWF